MGSVSWVTAGLTYFAVKPLKASYITGGIVFFNRESPDTFLTLMPAFLYPSKILLVLLDVSSSIKTLYLCSWVILLRLVLNPFLPFRRTGGEGVSTPETLSTILFKSKSSKFNAFLKPNILFVILALILPPRLSLVLV